MIPAGTGLLHERTIVVTGAGRGLGAAFAEACGLAGASVLVADINTQWGVATVQNLVNQGINASFAHVDIADPASVDAFALEVQGRYDGIDGLINNAALATGI